MSRSALTPENSPQAGGAPSSARQVLDGDWEFRPIAADGLAALGSAPRPPDGFERAPIRVPGYWNSFPPELGGDWGAYDVYRYPAHWSKAPAAWYRLRFRVADDLLADRPLVRMRFDAVAGRSTVWLNGRLLGSNDDSFLPFAFDVDAALDRSGENELVVLVEPPPTTSEGLGLQPCGSWVGWYLRGIWQSVYLEARPACAIADVFVQPSVRKQQLVVEVELEAAPESRGAEVQLTIRDSSGMVKDCGTQAVALSDRPTHVRFETPWADARLWCPEDPHLYQAEVVLRIGGQPVHARSVRFGFREFWIAGTEFRLNGRPVRLFGDSWHYMGVVQQNAAYARAWFQLARETGVNVIRTHAMPYPPCYFEVADEMGMMLIDESAVYGSAGTLALNEDRFWDNCREHVRRLVRRDRNHPSVIFWSACNETVWKGGEAIFDGLLSLSAEIAKLDPTRFTSFDENDCDLGGKAPLHAGHYGTPAHWERSWKRDRPLAIHEFSALYHGGPESVSPIGDEAVYADYLSRLRATGEDAAEMFLKLRRLGAASITPWNINWYCGEPGPAQAIEKIPTDCTNGGPQFDRLGARALTINYGYAPQQPAFTPNPAYAPLKACYARRRFYVPRKCRQAFAGDELTLEVAVWNDTDQPCVAELVFEIRGEKLDAARWSERIDLRPLEHVEKIIRVKAPLSRKPVSGEAVLCWSDPANGEHDFEERWPIHLHPRATEPRERARPVYMVGADGTPLAAWSARPLASVAEAAALLAEEFDDEPVVVLAGRHDGATLQHWLREEVIAEWLDDGGRLIVLPGGTADDLTDAVPRIRRACDVVFQRDAEGGVIDGLSADYWRDWPGGSVAVEVFPRPAAGCAYAPLDVGEPAEGLSSTPLLILPHGAGQVVLCGIPLLERAKDTPSARILLERLLHDFLPMEPLGQVVVAAAANAPLRRITETVGVIDCPEGISLLCDGSDPTVLGDPRVSKQALDAHLARGGRLILSAITPATAPEWSRRLGIPLEPESDERFNVARAGTPDVLAGLNNFDLCWVNRDEKQPIVRHTLTIDDDAFATLVETVATRWENYQTSAEQHKVGLMYRRLESFGGRRAALIQARRGHGRIIVCQLLLQEARGSFAARAQRVLSRLLDVIGAERSSSVSLLAPRDRPVTDADGYITQWLVLGPFAGENGHPLDHAFVNETALRPHEGLDQSGRTWRRIGSALPQVELDAAWPERPARDRVAYAAVYVYAGRDRSVLLDAPDMLALRSGADGGAKVLLNGQPIGRFDFVRECVLDSDRIDAVPLKAGWNVLVVKLHNPSGRWRFAARFLTAAGEPASELQYRLEPPAS